MRIARDAAGRDDGAMLLTCQKGYEDFLARELEDAGGRVVERGAGWVRAVHGARSGSKVEGQRSNVGQATDTGGGAGGGDGGRAVSDQAQAARANFSDLAFTHLGLVEPVEMVGESVNMLAAGVADYFLKSLQGERVEAAWPCVWAGPHEVVGLGRRVGAVEAAFGELLRKRFSRVAKLAVRGDNLQLSTFNIEPPARNAPQPAAFTTGGSTSLTTGGSIGLTAGMARGLFVYFTDFRRAFVAREAWSGGQRRMADDPLAPSRSFLKIEEAYGVLGAAPRAGETVADLGAAPGGWSYSAAKRGARVVAVDNGPLKGGALGHPLIEHRREDAFGFRPTGGERGAGTPPTSDGTAVDWLFCDLLEEPHHVLRNLVAPWLEHGWCRRFVVNLKFGRVDPVALLRDLRGAESVFSRHAGFFRVRHLYHDREELTVVGETRAAQ